MKDAVPAWDSRLDTFPASIERCSRALCSTDVAQKVDREGYSGAQMRNRRRPRAISGVTRDHLTAADWARDTLAPPFFLSMRDRAGAALARACLMILRQLNAGTLAGPVRGSRPRASARVLRSERPSRPVSRRERGSEIRCSRSSWEPCPSIAQRLNGRFLTAHASFADLPDKFCFFRSATKN